MVFIAHSVANHDILARAGMSQPTAALPPADVGVSDCQDCLSPLRRRWKTPAALLEPFVPYHPNGRRRRHFAVGARAGEGPPTAAVLEPSRIDRRRPICGHSLSCAAIAAHAPNPSLLGASLKGPLGGFRPFPIYHRRGMPRLLSSHSQRPPTLCLSQRCQAGRSNGRGYPRSRGFVVPRSLRRFGEGYNAAHRSFRPTCDCSPAPNDRDAKQRCCRSAARQCGIATLCPEIALGTGSSALRAAPVRESRVTATTPKASPACATGRSRAFRGMTTSRR